MNNKLKKIIAYVYFSSLAFQAQAGQLSDALEGMYTATTNPQAFRTPTMNGVAFGSASIRFPTQNFNIVAFDPPRINAGCSGIDMYMGSFSFINAEQLKTMLRAFAQGAVGFAFKSAIRAICGSCAATLDDLQHITQRINEMGKNTCALSKLAADKMLPDALTERAETSESLLKTARSSVDGWWSGFETLKTGSKGDRGNRHIGNLVIRALYNSQATDQFGANGGTAFYGMSGDLPELIMNLVGTTVVPSGSNDTKTCSSGDSGADCTAQPKVIIGRLNFDHILHGKSNGGERITFYRCDEKQTEMSCQNPTDDKDFDFEGTERFVTRMLFGVDGDAMAPVPGSIMDVVLNRGPGALSNQQKTFLSSIQAIPVMQIMVRTQRDRSIAKALLEQSSSFIAHDMAYKIVSQAIQVTEKAFSGNTVTMPDEMRDRIRFLRSDIQQKGYQNPQKIVNMLNGLESLIGAMERRWPKVEGMAWRR